MSAHAASRIHCLQISNRKRLGSPQNRTARLDTVFARPGALAMANSKDIAIDGLIRTQRTCVNFKHTHTNVHLSPITAYTKKTIATQ
jgi:hypothetical protein